MRCERCLSGLFQPYGFAHGGADDAGFVVVFPQEGEDEFDVFVFVGKSAHLYDAAVGQHRFLVVDAQDAVVTSSGDVAAEFLAQVVIEFAGVAVAGEILYVAFVFIDVV